MKVIFLQHVPGRGEKNQIKEISDGYARNFLIPRGLAAPATPEKMAKIEAERSAKDAKAVEDEKRIRSAAAALRAEPLEFKLKGDEHGSVFGSVTKDAIAKALLAHGIEEGDKAEVEIEHPLKQLGDHTIKIRFKRGLEAEISVRVVKEG